MDYSEIKARCNEESKLVQEVIDGFLLHFMAPKAGMTKRLTQAKQQYKHIIKELPDEFFPKASAEYIVGRTMMRGGLLGQHMNHPRIQQLGDPAISFLQAQERCPWRYVFGRIVARPAEQFFLLQDEIIGEELLVFSPGMDAFCEAGHEASLYFLLLGFNGMCWQSYGLIAPFRSFDMNDVCVFGTEVFSAIEDDQTFMAAVHRDPLPFFMLMIGQESPHLMSGEHELRHCVAEQDLPHMDPSRLAPDFTVAWNRGVCRIQLDDWKAGPHFASAYWDEGNQVLHRYAMTQPGFDALTAKLIEAGVPVPPEADYSLSVSMSLTLSQILKRKLKFHDFDRLFDEPNEGAMPAAEVDKLNAFLADLMPHINSGDAPNLASLASTHGVDLQTAEELYRHFKDKLANL